MIFKMKTNQLPVVRFIGQIAYHQPWKHFERYADEYILYIIKKGDMFIEEDGQRYHLKKRDFFLFEPHKTHKGYLEAPCDYFHIHFSNLPLQQTPITGDSLIQELRLRRYVATTSNCLSNELPNDSTCFIPKHFHLDHLDYYGNKLRESINNYEMRIENYKEIVSTELLHICIKIAREYATYLLNNASNQVSKPLHKATEVLHYIHREYTNKITGSILADYFDANIDYLNRCFKQLTGNTLNHYINMLRVSKAQELIITTNMKFSEIAYLVGIDNPYYFSRLFKQYTGCTATDFYHEHVTQKNDTV